MDSESGTAFLVARSLRSDSVNPEAARWAS